MLKITLILFFFIFLAGKFLFSSEKDHKVTTDKTPATPCVKKTDTVVPENYFYHEVNQIYKGRKDYQSIELDLNKDAVRDFLILMQYGPEEHLYTIAPAYSPSEIIVTSYGNNKILFHSDLSMADSIPPVKSLALGERLEGHWGRHGRISFRWKKDNWRDKGVKYMGFRLEKDRIIYSGWIRMQVSSRGRVLEIKDYAYSRYTSLHAGKK